MKYACSLALIACMVGLVGCSEKTQVESKEALEQTSEAIKSAAEDTVDNVKNAAEKTGDAIKSE